jgi:hypothetical protein
MSTDEPAFMDSPYFVMELNNWHLKPGAPAEVQKEFDEFMKLFETPVVDRKKDKPEGRKAV